MAVRNEFRSAPPFPHMFRTQNAVFRNK